MASNLIKTKMLAICLLSLVSNSALAAFTYKMNAMCYLEGADGREVDAFNPTKQEIQDSDSEYVENKATNVTDEDVEKKFRIASLSKILVSHWAVAKLGPEYRFKTTFYVTKNRADKSCFVHIKGSGDIFMGREILMNGFNQLNGILKNQNCQKVAQLSYDENVVVPMFANMDFILQHRNVGGYRGNNPDQYYGPRTTKKALTYIVQKLSPIKADEIKPSLAADFEKYRQTTEMKAFSFKSRPLFMLLREFNTVSSNVPPNILFETLGGRAKYKEFIANRLQLDSSDLNVYNGSGYPLFVDEERFDNEVSCSAFVRIVQDLDNMLRDFESTKKFQLADIMPVGGPNEGRSTLSTLYSGSTFNNTLVAKTGSANEAITFGGMISTTEGPVYFAAFTAPSEYNMGQLYRPRTYIRDLVTVLMERYELKPFDYRQIGLMNPYDNQATLVEESGTTLSTTMK